MNRLILSTMVLTINCGIAQEQKPLNVCELLMNFKDYEGKIVSVRGELIAGPETFALNSIGCDVSQRPYPELEPGITLAWPAAVKDSRVELAPNTRAAVKTIMEEFGMSTDFFAPLVPRVPSSKGRAIIVVTGRFNGRMEMISYPNGRKFYFGYGNLGLYPARLVIQSVQRDVNDSAQAQCY